MLINHTIGYKRRIQREKFDDHLSGLSPQMNSIQEIENQVNNLLANRGEPKVRVAYILSQIDLSIPDEKLITKHTLHSIARLYIFRVIKGFNNYEKLKEYLEDHPEEAFLLGFYRSENNSLEIPPKRTFNNYILSLDKKFLNSIAEKIMALTTQNNKILDLEIVKKVEKEKIDTLQKETREAVRIIKKLVYPNIPLHLAKNSKFKSKDFLDVLVHVASRCDFTNNGANTFKISYPEKETPSGDLMMYHFSKFEKREDILAIYDRILEVIFDFAKSNYNLLRNRAVDIAYDIHKIPYYGKRIGFTCGDKYERGTSEFIEFLTCSIVEEGVRFIIDVIPIHTAFDLSKIIDHSLTKVRRKVKIKKVYCDKGFNSVKIFKVLKNHCVRFLMPIVRTNRIKKLFDEAEHSKAKVFKDYKIGNKDNNEKVNIIIVDDKDGVKHSFVCNFEVEEQNASMLYALYSKRWGIETGYRNLDHDFKPRTTTRNYNIRLFYFLFSCCLYNLWVLTNICVMLTVHGRIKEKPIITAKLFAIILYMVKLGYET